MPTVDIYCDGACSGNPGPGGWGAVLIYGKHIREISGYCELTTNNKMELTACIEALSCLKTKCNVNVYTDSAYLCNAINQHWIDNWLRNGWKKADKKVVENVELWKQLLMLMERHVIRFIKVKGHADNELNNRADRLAVTAIKTANS